MGSGAVEKSTILPLNICGRYIRDAFNWTFMFGWLALGKRARDFSFICTEAWISYTDSGRDFTGDLNKIPWKTAFMDFIAYAYILLSGLAFSCLSKKAGILPSIRPGNSIAARVLMYLTSVAGTDTSMRPR